MINFNFSSEESVSKKVETKVTSFIEKSKMNGWYDIKVPDSQKIKEAASFIKNNSTVFLVLGTGGQYRGYKTVIESLSSYFYNDKLKPKIYFLGNNLSADYYFDLLEKIKGEEIIVNVVSKSGETFEIKTFYNLIMNFMKTKYSSEELKKRIVITTNSTKGFLLDEAKKNQFVTFTIPENIGGRYSIFTPMVLLPAAVAGIDIDRLVEGAKEGNKYLKQAIKYAMIRKQSYKKRKHVEAYTIYEPKLTALTEWLKQLYAESLGKNEKGMLPISLINTTDLHSLGQFVQDGTKILIETTISVGRVTNDTKDELSSKNLSELNDIAKNATITAHKQAGIVSNEIIIDSLNEYDIGLLMQFFMISCATSGYLEKVNPFDQPGVEAYKNEMKKLLGDV